MNKETLQNYNTKLNANNTSLNDILETINGMSEIKLGEKTITKKLLYFFSFFSFNFPISKGLHPSPNGIGFPAWVHWLFTCDF